ncbi:MAG TPA: serine/threonine-protein kinase, partial [Polyangiaceae bacterium]|nr:serine/threonine-protein kinase [Polyangiaceae bacterium]
MKQGDLVASKYRLIARLGQGGMGEVWSAAHVQTEREFAIKFMHQAIAATSEDARHRFIQEARASAKINHPNIIDIFDVGETEEGSLYLVMELLEGMSLGELLRAEPGYTARDLLVVLAGTLSALVAAHAAGVVHRDIKPPNIYLHRDRATGVIRTKVVDFGVSKILMGDEGFATHTGSLLGSPRYMSPEQAISATSADGRADVWSIGVVMFEALTGRFPHEGDSSNSIVIAIAMQPPRSIHEVAPHLPLALRTLVDACIRPVGERIQTAAELLERVLDTLRSNDLRDVPLARPATAKGRTRPRPTGFVIGNDVDAIPGVTTTRSVPARDRHPSHATLLDPTTPNASNEDATLIHVPAQIRATGPSDPRASGRDLAPAPARAR